MAFFRGLVIMLFLILICSASYAVNARLLGMGDMSGIIPDRRDYVDHIYKINDIKQKTVNIDYLSNVFKNDFPQNDQPSSNIYEYQRKGARDSLGANIVLPVNDVVNLGYQHEYEYRDYRASYIDAVGDWQTLGRTGHSEIQSLILGYRVLSWFDLAVSYDETSQTDDYSGSETGRTGVNVLNEGGQYRGLACGLRLHWDSFWFGLAVGEIKESKLTYEATAPLLRDSVTGPGRASLLIGGSLFDNKLIINYGGWMRRIGLLSRYNASLGCQWQAQDNLLLGFGIKAKYDTDQNGTFNSSSINLGGEYEIKYPLVARVGLVSRISQLSASSFFFSDRVENICDYTLGLGYELFGMQMDFAYLNYAGILGGSYYWSAMSSELMSQYVYTDSSERSSAYVFSISHRI